MAAVKSESKVQILPWSSKETGREISMDTTCSSHSYSDKDEEAASESAAEVELEDERQKAALARFLSAIRSTG